MTLPSVYPVDSPALPDLTAPHLGAVALYGLYDPRDGALRYVGKTVDVRARYWAHVVGHDRDLRAHRCRWLAQLRALGLRPRLLILEWSTDAQWEQAERRLIAYARAQGCRLTNIAEGGRGARHGLAGRLRFSARLKGHTVSPETRAKISAAQRGIPKDPVRYARGTPRRTAAIKRTWALKNTALVQRVRALAAQGLNYAVIAEDCGITPGVAWAIGTRRRYAYVPDPPELGLTLSPQQADLVGVRYRRPRGEGNRAARLCAQQVTEIRALAAAGHEQRAIGRRFGVSQYTVWSIIHHRTWAHVP